MLRRSRPQTWFPTTGTTSGPIVGMVSGNTARRRAGRGRGPISVEVMSSPTPGSVPDSPSPVQAPEIGVSVIMTVQNEAGHLADSIASVLAQNWSGPLQIVVAIGPSVDETVAVARRLAADDERIQLLDNPTGKTPAGLNIALAAARHDVVVRVDGHCVLPPGYLTAAVTTLSQTGAANVGGVMAAAGTTTFERAVAAAMTSKLGVGSAAFHVGGVAGPAETVYLGVFRREALCAVGGYDETFDRAQDWEMNHRIRAAGGLVWFTPELSVTYRPRATVAGLARQYFNYGRWRRRVMTTHRGTAQVRYLAAPAAVGVMGIGIAVAAAGLVTGNATLQLGMLAPIGYAVAVTLGGVVLAAQEPWSVRTRVPVALATMHCAWGVGFLIGVRPVSTAANATPKPAEPSSN